MALNLMTALAGNLLNPSEGSYSVQKLAVAYLVADPGE